MKFATALIDPAVPMIVSPFPERVKGVSIGASYRIGQRVQEFLPAGTVPLKFLDNVNALLQDRLLPLEFIDLRLQLYEPGLLAGLFLDVQPHFGNLLVGRMPVVIEHTESHEQSRHEENDLQSGFERDGLPRGFRTGSPQ